MTDLPVRELEMGQLALALVIEDFRQRVARQETTETEVAAVMESALAHFPPEFEPDIRKFLATARADRTAAVQTA